MSVLTEGEINEIEMQFNDANARTKAFHDEYANSTEDNKKLMAKTFKPQMDYVIRRHAEIIEKLREDLAKG